MQMFRDVLDQCSFMDLGYSEPNFTWHGQRTGELNWERLDQGVANYDWLLRFPTGRVRHLHCFTSDHCLIILALDPNGENHKWRRKPFRFEAIWLIDPGLKDIVTRVWDCNVEGTPMFTTTKKLKKCKRMLKAWNSDHLEC